MTANLVAPLGGHTPVAPHTNDGSPHFPNEVIRLTEFQPQRFASECFTSTEAETIWREYRSQVLVEPPSFKTGGQWQLTGQGWIGLLPFSTARSIALVPKVPIANLFEMVAYVYDIHEVLEKSLNIGPPLLNSDFAALEIMQRYMDQLARRLALGVGQLLRKGLAQSYSELASPLPYVRGQIDINALVSSAASSSAQLHELAPREIVCRFEELTVDIRENQVLLWTLHLLARSYFFSDETRALCRHCVTHLRSHVRLAPCREDECDLVQFDRLNQPYRPLLAICRFFLHGYGPQPAWNDNRTPFAIEPFMLNSAQLFERYVAAWLTHNLAPQLRVEVQERRYIKGSHPLHFAIDLAIYDRETNNALYVMDTKYKSPLRAPSTSDIAQVVTYAEAIGATEGLLVYPTELTEPLDTQIGRIRVRTLCFDLSMALDDAGAKFLQAI